MFSITFFLGNRQTANCSTLLQFYTVRISNFNKAFVVSMVVYKTAMLFFVKSP